MVRQVIRIDEEKCKGCGICAEACHEGAIGMVNGKARLLRDDYCDGMGDCLPACPMDAISFETREAAPYDRAAAEKNMSKKQTPPTGGCPGSTVRQITTPLSAPINFAQPSQLRNWPVQIKLAPIQAPYFRNAHLLIAADCTAFAYGNFHAEFMSGRVTLIGCPKLDGVDYSEKLGAILAANSIQSITLLRMQVPCCGGLEMAARRALQASGKDIPFRTVTITIDGNILK